MDSQPEADELYPIAVLIDELKVGGISRPISSHTFSLIVAR